MTGRHDVPPDRAPAHTRKIPDPQALRVAAADGAAADILLLHPAGEPRQLLYWLPAMGVPARHYLPLAQALADHGAAVALHEWRGIGSSNRRANRRQNWGYKELLAGDLPAGLAAVRERLPQATCWLGGHSLGGQLAALYASQHASLAGLVLVASGAPYWRCFPHRWLIRAAYTLAPMLAGLLGHFPGRRIGFGGNEARGVIRDWARSGRTGRYTVAGTSTDWERRLAGVQLPLLAIRFADDWLGPPSSLAWLLDKVPDTSRQLVELTAGPWHPADHFSWISAPGPVATCIGQWLRSQNAAFAGGDAGPLEDPAGGGTSCGSPP